MTTVIRRFADVTPTPWSNNLGLTWELVDDPCAVSLTPGHSWRLSVARLDTPAPFSQFRGLHRTLLPWGGGITLEIDNNIHHVGHGQTVRFAGDSQTRLVEIGRPCHAINLISPATVPKLARVDTGKCFDHQTVALITEQSDAADQFDVLVLPAGRMMPSRAVIVAL